jgi:methyl-accepting chemotaxis protein
MEAVQADLTRRMAEMQAIVENVTDGTDRVEEVVDRNNQEMASLRARLTTLQPHTEETRTIAEDAKGTSNRLRDAMRQMNSGVKPERLVDLWISSMGEWKSWISTRADASGDGCPAFPG